MEIPKAIRSSADNQKISLTLTGALILVILYIARRYGLTATEQDATMIAELIINIGAMVVTLFGAVRRVIYRDRILK